MVGLLLTDVSGYAQLITVLIIFVVVLFATAWVTKFVAGYQKGKNAGRNVSVVETTQIANNKYVQIIKVGNKYKAVCVCKDTVTYLGEVDADSLKSYAEEKAELPFKDIFDRMKKQTKENR